MSGLQRVYVGVGSTWSVIWIYCSRLDYTSFGGDLISQLTSIKQGEVVVALGRGSSFIMMVGK